MTVEGTALVERGQIIQLGDPVFMIYKHPCNETRYFAVSETSPYFCLEGGSIAEAAALAQDTLERYQEFQEDDGA